MSVNNIEYMVYCMDRVDSKNMFRHLSLWFLRADLILLNEMQNMDTVSMETGDSALRVNSRHL